MSSHIIKQSLKTSVVNYLGIILGAIFTLYISPKYLDTEYNGLYRLLMEYAVVAGSYFHFGIPTIINKYFHQIFDGSGYSTKGFDFIVLLLPVIAIAILGVLLAIFRRDITYFISSTSDFDLIYKYLLYIIPLIIANSYSLLIEAYTAMLGNIVKVNFYRNVLVKCFNIVSVVVYALTLNFTIAMVIISGGAMLSVILSFVNLGNLKKWTFDLRPSLEFLSLRGLKKDFFRYALYLVLGNLTIFLVTKIDVFFVGKYANLSDLAYYTTAMFFIVFISVPYQAVLNISFPYISKCLSKEDMQGINLVLRDNAIFGFSLALFIALEVWINIDFIYAVMPRGELYSAGKYAFLILAVGKLIDISIGSLGQLLTVSKWYIYTLYFSILISVISVVLGYNLILIWGIYGSATAIAICNIIGVVYQLSIVGWKLKISPYSRNFIYVLLLIVPVLLISMLTNALISNIWLKMIVKSSLVTVVFFGAIYKYKLSVDINTIINHMIIKLKL